MITIATICARGGSQGLPGKNIRPLFGKPLIGYSIEQAQKCKGIDKVFVSTDSTEIADVAKTFGAEVPFLRPPDLSTPRASKLPVIRHLVDHVIGSGVSVNRIVDLDPTSPLRNVSDIDACLRLLTDDVSVVPTAYESEKNPYFNMIEPKRQGGFKLSKVTSLPVVRRQDAPTVYAMNASIYTWWTEQLDKTLFSEGTRLHVMPRERSIDIDSPLDFEIVEMLMKKHNQHD